jgi:hypothetical protein
MLSLFKILIIDSTNEDPLQELKRLIYQLLYMDNGAISCGDADRLSFDYDKIHEIFNTYGFKLQQFLTNDEDLQRRIDEEQNVEVPTSITVKLLGTM